MDLRDYALVLRKRWRLIALCTLLAVAAALAATLAATPMYSAQAQLFVSTSQSDANTTGGLVAGGQFAQQRVKSYANLVDSQGVTEAVVEELDLDISAQQLESQIEATAPLDTVLINVDVEDESPVLAQRIANAVALRFTEVAAELETPEGAAASPVKVSVVRAADLPTTPVSPRPALNLALGLLVGAAVGVGAAVLRETLDTTVKGADDITNALDLPTLGLIGFDSGAVKRPLIVHDDPHSSRSEAFRQLRTNLQFVDIDHKPRSIVVTSSIPSEGKSTTTCNLALALTQAGVRVILVEADLRRPRLAEYLGLENAIGLTDALVGRAELDDLLQPWGDGRLQVLASGPTPPNPSELLGSQQMAELLKDLEGRCDLVLLDAPPLLPVTDAAVLTTHASGAIVIVRSGHTTREQAARAVEILRGVDAHLYGAVLNMVPTKGPGAYKYGYYGYGYAPTSSAQDLPPVEVGGSRRGPQSPVPAAEPAAAAPTTAAPAPDAPAAPAPTAPPAPAEPAPPYAVPANEPSSSGTAGTSQQWP